MKRNYVSILSLMFLLVFISSCSLQKQLNPERFNYIQAKNQLTTDLALISEVEHITIHRLQLNQITPQRAENIDKSIKEIQFELDLAKKLLEAGNYKGSLKISQEQYKKLQILKKTVLSTE